MADTDLLSLDEAKAAVNFDEDISDKDDEIAALNSGVSEAVDSLCGPVVAREVTEYHSARCGTILLRTTPVYEITTVTEYDTAGTGTVLTAEDFDTKPAAGYLLEADGHLARLSRRYSGSAGAWLYGDRNLVIVFEAGRCASTDTVPYRFKAAAKLIVARAWQQTAGAWARSRNLPDVEDDFGGGFLSIEQMVRSALESELLPPGIG